MKQNERILVYAVTGFLAVILVVAVLFGRETPPNKPTIGGGAPNAGAASPALSELIPKKGADGAGKDDASAGSQSGLLSPGEVAPEQPLAAPGKTLILAELVAQTLGASRRDRNVRFVHAQRGDSLESLVRRWCGARDPYLEEAQFLNEELSVVKVGQEVAVPWVDDEQVYAAYEARQPKKLVAEAAGSGTGAPVPAVAGNAGVGSAGVGNPGVGNSVLGDAAPPPVRNPTFAVPGNDPSVANPTSGAPNAGAPAAGRTKTYVVKSGDSLWKIAEKLYGRKNADRMVGEIKKLNPGKTERVLPDQKLVVPDAAPVAGGA